jgi:hypothetical protein
MHSEKYIKLRVLLFSPQHFSEICLIFIRIQRFLSYPHILMQISCYSYNILMTLESSEYIFEKYIQSSNLIKIRLTGTELFYAYGRTDKPDETNIRFSKFCEWA